MGRTDIFTMLSILIREHSVSLRLFWSFFIPFINHHFVILSIQVHVCFFGAVVNGITFLILIFPCVSFVYRNKVDSCMFILYPVILLNSFINSRSFCRLLRISTWTVILSVNIGYIFFYFFFFEPVFLFISLSCRIALAGTSSTRLN